MSQESDITLIQEGLERMMELDKCDYGVCMDAQNALAECQKTIQELKDIINETIWMARRYADGRSTYAPEMCNQAIDKAIALGINLDEGPIDPIYAKDGMFGEWVPEKGRFEKG